MSKEAGLENVLKLHFLDLKSLVNLNKTIGKDNIWLISPFVSFYISSFAITFVLNEKRQEIQVCIFVIELKPQHLFEVFIDKFTTFWGYLWYSNLFIVIISLFHYSISYFLYIRRERKENLKHFYMIVYCGARSITWIVLPPFTLPPFILGKLTTLFFHVFIWFQINILISIWHGI